MKNKAYIFFVVVVVAMMVAGFFVAKKEKNIVINNSNVANNDQQPEANNQLASPPDMQNTKPQTVDPIDGALARITKKPFGILINPKTSPVQPERFSGYHTAVDLETTPDEQNIAVPVKVFCDGKLLIARSASGYGGVAVQACNLDGQAVTIVYGHIKLTSVRAKVGDQLKAGDFLADLGTGFSQETDGERKHLHFGIHKGNSVNILGYVQNKNQLNNWIDPIKYLN